MVRMRPVLMLVLVLGVCTAGTAVIPQATNSHSAQAPDQRVDINRASMEELLKVPGMTRSWAGRVVRFRPYRSKQDLLDKGIVSGEVYNRIKDYIIAHRESTR
jgi:competence protein ComEA